jgi:hypothetical protein
MDMITGGYLALLVAGLVWVLYRVIRYVRIQTERDQLWEERMSREELQAFIETFKKESVQTDKPRDPSTPQP